MRFITNSVEFLILFLFLPVVIYFAGTRWSIPLSLWLVGGYVFIRLRQQPNFNWTEIWHGNGWPREEQKKALLRYGISIPAIILLTYYIEPDRLFSFPLQRPILWLAVMVLYPLLSVIPQELIFRTYFFQRYNKLFGNPRLLLLANAGCFALIHVVFHNWVSPLLCLVGGYIFASSYARHRSLKWAVIEHAAYGCLVFTAGLGFYFLKNGGGL
jgi:membrane protease YdiL (CAAX protease family)